MLDNYDYTAMLEEAQKYYETQIRSFTVLRKHAELILGIATALLSLFAAFGVNNVRHCRYKPYTIIILMLILYGILIIKSLTTVLPGFIHYPVKPTEHQYIKSFLNKNKDEITKQRLSNYLNVIPKNDGILRERRESGRLITFLLGAIIVLVLIYSLY